MERIRNCFRAVSDFLHSPLFSPYFMTRVHFIQLLLVIIMISLTGARIAVKPSGMPVTRSDTLGIVMVRLPFVLLDIYPRIMADRTMAGDQNTGGALLPTDNNSHHQAQTLAKSEGVPNLEYDGNRLLVRGDHNRFHGDITILSGYILRFELADCPHRRHFNVSIASILLWPNLSPVAHRTV